MSRFIRAIRPTNILSFGPNTSETELSDLNVLIGVNGAGKSNLIEVIGLLKAAPVNIADPIRTGGGIRDWLWKGALVPPDAHIDATIDYPDGSMPLRYKLSFGMVGQKFELIDEAVENEKPSVEGASDPYFFYRYQEGHPALNVRTTMDAGAGQAEGRTQRFLRHEDISLERSVLSQRKDPDQYPEITYLSNQFEKINLFREWSFGRTSDPRLPQPADLSDEFLMENARNLGMVLNDLEHRGEPGRQIIKQLQQFYEPVQAIINRVHGGTVQIYIRENGFRDPVPATRLSDGTLRYLCLLSILCHPTPPPLICFEEPELGLHPDVLPGIAELLVEASTRTQLIVTTHSDVLVSALTDEADSVLVCDRDETGTSFRRLDSQDLQTWLEDYTLGELWRMGEIGGTR
ncbi:MAG: AAA family ATPase [Deltaproteobacteria bacterium]|nr:AAA family ATPase [Deltaproteobacteria bacterium]